MSELKTSEVVRTALLALWGMATLVLLFSLALLVYQMTQRGDTPGLVPLAKGPAPAVLKEPAAPVTAKAITLYFLNHDGSALGREVRRIEMGENAVENCRRALDALIEGPREDLAPVIAAATRVRGMYLLDNGELVVDFSRDLEAGQVRSPSAEMFMVRAIVATLTQPGLAPAEGPRIRGVRFLFEGAPPQEGYPVHLDLSAPVVPKAAWLSGDVMDGGNA